MTDLLVFNRENKMIQMNKIIILIGILISTSAFSTPLSDKYTPESKKLLNQLQQEIKSTVLAVAESETSAGKDMTNFSYKMSIPAKQYINLGLSLDFENAEQGYPVVSVASGSIAQQLGIKPNDIILAINNERISGLPSEDVIAMLRSLSPGERLTLGIESAGEFKTFTTGLSSINIPSALLAIGSDASMAAEEGSENNEELPSPTNHCGMISVFYSTPEARDIFPVLIKKVNDLNIRKNLRTIKLSVGKHILYLDEEIDSGINFNTRRSKDVKRFEIEVKANTIYHLGAQFNRTKRFKTFSGEYWDPVVWKKSKRECSFD